MGGCATACRGLDANYGATGLASHAAVLQAAAAVNLRLPQPVAPHLLLGMKQKSVTVLLDKAGWQQQLASTSVVGRAVLHSEAEPGGRAWLAAVPCGRKRLEAAAFVIELRQRLGLADASADAFCPCCEGVLDRFSLHAGTCVAGGERTQRHNAVRDLLAAWAERAGFRPELEKPGLLLPQRPDDTRVAHRRPADIYLPSSTELLLPLT